MVRGFPEVIPIIPAAMSMLAGEVEVPEPEYEDDDEGDE